MEWFVYELPPIDFGWENLKTVSDTAGNLANIKYSILAEKSGKSGATELAMSGVQDVDEFMDRWGSAKSAARECGWDGDFRIKPVVFWMPSDTEFVSGFVFKQDNNGTTYVVSPVELPYLDQFSG